jgi:hypothetical protein
MKVGRRHRELAVDASMQLDTSQFNKSFFIGTGSKKSSRNAKILVGAQSSSSKRSLNDTQRVRHLEDIERQNLKLAQKLITTRSIINYDD